MKMQNKLTVGRAGVVSWFSYEMISILSKFSFSG
jgi:hypothetical protein